MTKLAPLDAKTLVRIFKADGFEVKRQTGSHIIMAKSGVTRSLVIPVYREVGIDIIKSNMRSAGMSRKRFFELLENL